MPRQYAKPDPEKYCQVCGVRMHRKRYGPSQTLEDMGRFLSRRTCGQSCGNTKTEVKKDTLHWRARKHRKPNCEQCQTAEDLHVHHIDRDPTNNDPANLLTLCASCHLKLHWREDREKRMQGVAKMVATVAANGGHMRPRSTDGRFASAD